MIKKIISVIKSKKQLSSLEDKFVEKLILKFFENNPKLKARLENHPKIEKSKEFKVVVKSVRKELHDVYEVFKLDPKRSALLECLKKYLDKNKLDKKAIELHEQILETHQSTKERLNDYEEVYKKILYPKPQKILDLAAGLNPLSFPWMKLKKVDYIASELSSEDCKFINDYFKIMKKFGLNGKVMQLDLLDKCKLPKVDICFLFKTLDSLESLKKNISRNLLNSIDAKKIVISFPTKTLSGKKLSEKRLVWFERLAKDFEIFEVENEIFYILHKTKIY